MKLPSLAAGLARTRRAHGLLLLAWLAHHALALAAAAVPSAALAWCLAATPTGAAMVAGSDDGEGFWQWVLTQADSPLTIPALLLAALAAGLLWQLVWCAGVVTRWQSHEPLAAGQTIAAGIPRLLSFVVVALAFLALAAVASSTALALGLLIRPLARSGPAWVATLVIGLRLLLVGVALLPCAAAAQIAKWQLAAGATPLAAVWRGLTAVGSRPLATTRPAVAWAAATVALLGVWAAARLLAALSSPATVLLGHALLAAWAYALVRLRLGFLLAYADDAAAPEETLEIP